MSAPLAKASRMPVTSRGGSQRDPMIAPMTSALDAARPKRIAVSTDRLSPAGAAGRNAGGPQARRTARHVAGRVVESTTPFVEVRRQHDRRADDPVDPAVDTVETAPVAVLAEQETAAARAPRYVARDRDGLRPRWKNRRPTGGVVSVAAVEVAAVEGPLGRVAEGVLVDASCRG